MEGNCSLCNVFFVETTVQAWRRKKDNTGLICPSCQRISRAEEAARKRALKKAKPLSPIEELKRKYGKLSITLLMMKLKFSYADAKKICEDGEVYDDRRNQDVHENPKVL